MSLLSKEKVGKEIDRCKENIERIKSKQVEKIGNRGVEYYIGKLHVLNDLLDELSKHK